MLRSSNSRKSFPITVRQSPSFSGFTKTRKIDFQNQTWKMESNPKVKKQGKITPKKGSAIQQNHAIKVKIENAVYEESKEGSDKNSHHYEDSLKVLQEEVQNFHEQSTDNFKEELALLSSTRLAKKKLQSELDENLDQIASKVSSIEEGKRQLELAESATEIAKDSYNERSIQYFAEKAKSIELIKQARLVIEFQTREMERASQELCDLNQIYEYTQEEENLIKDELSAKEKELTTAQASRENLKEKLSQEKINFKEEMKKLYKSRKKCLAEWKKRCMSCNWSDEDPVCKIKKPKREKSD